MSGRADDFGGLGRGGVTSYNPGGFVIGKKYIPTGSDGGAGISIVDAGINVNSICVATYNSALIPTGASNYVTSCNLVAQHEFQIFWSSNTSLYGDYISYFIATKGTA